MLPYAVINSFTFFYIADLILSVLPFLLDPGEDGAGAEAVAQPLTQPPGGRGGAQRAGDVAATPLLLVDHTSTAERAEKGISVSCWAFQLHIVLCVNLKHGSCTFRGLVDHLSLSLNVVS